MTYPPRPRRTRSVSNPEHGYIGDDDPIPEGFSSVPLHLPAPALIDQAADPQRAELLREVVANIAEAIAKVHDAEHRAHPGADHDAVPHVWTSQVASSAGHLLLDTFGTRPDLLAGIVMELAVFMALEAYDDGPEQ